VPKTIASIFSGFGKGLFARNYRRQDQRTVTNLAKCQTLEVVAYKAECHPHTGDTDLHIHLQDAQEGQHTYKKGVVLMWISAEPHKLLKSNLWRSARIHTMTTPSFYVNIPPTSLLGCTRNVSHEHQ